MSSLWDISPLRINIYYIIVFAFLIYSLIRFRSNNLFLLIIFLFFIGMFVYAGKSVQNIYRIFIVVTSIYMSRYSVTAKTVSTNIFITISFVLFSILLLLSSYLHRDNFTLIFSQYSRFLIVFLFYFILHRRLSHPVVLEKFNQLIYYLILLQIILSFVKFIVIGPMESIVGSLGFSGGAIATSFPLLGMVFLWMYRKGNFSNKDWLFILGLMFIGFVNYKRAIWFVLPFFLGLFIFYVERRKLSEPILLAFALIPLLLYLGIRLNPTLNKEQKVWGSFDMEYAYKYIDSYSFGKENEFENQQTAQGRGGATGYLFEKLFKGELNSSDWFGSGLSMMYVEGAQNEGAFLDKYQLNSIGSANGFFQSYVVFGLTGALITIVFALSLLLKIQNRRIRFAMMFLFFWEYFFYTGVILRELPLNFLLIYLILYSNQQFGRFMPDWKNTTAKIALTLR
jgi:hypothetical protein